ncbi:hypothetical protein PCL_07755 [Purpureocillium lilacinum]|uniref:Uncharacterized protein n=1 Tax=Purpureocillium lilacinum TaxID=33203 RepID=A0A2U3EIV6_PURLI|nr:hypothetical protein PCL_07755 [Purpureocillium lilacinum]
MGTRIGSTSSECPSTACETSLTTNHHAAVINWSSRWNQQQPIQLSMRVPDGQQATSIAPTHRPMLPVCLKTNGVQAGLQVDAKHRPWLPTAQRDRANTEARASGPAPAFGGPASSRGGGAAVVLRWC